MKLINDLLKKVAEKGTRSGKNVIAFSGGIDSSLVASLVHKVYPNNSFACIGVSPSLPPEQKDLARRISAEIGIHLEEIETREADDPNYIANVGQSCYYCKTHLYSALEAIALRVTKDWNGGSKGRYTLFNGTNKDDTKDNTRVGLKAAREFEVCSPLDDLTKEEVRAAAKYMNLSNWNYAASPCLRSRLEIGVSATKEKLTKVNDAERTIRENITFSVSDNLRVRLMHDDKALIEVDYEKFQSIKEKLPYLSRQIISLGFTSVDVRIFKSGSVSQMVEKV